MSATVSPAAGKQYGISRTCTVLAWPRSSCYFQRSPRPKRAGKPGPNPKWSDAEVLQFIHRDLERSPLQSEGHRKVRARLKILDGFRVGWKRLLRIMREPKLL